MEMVVILASLLPKICLAAPRTSNGALRTKVLPVHQGLLHGPYVYWRLRQKGVQHKYYVPMSRLAEVLEARDAFGLNVQQLATSAMDHGLAA